MRGREEMLRLAAYEMTMVVYTAQGGRGAHQGQEMEAGSLEDSRRSIEQDT